MKKFLVILMGVLMVIGGLICLFRPAETFMGTAGYMVGVIILFDAIGSITLWSSVKKYVNVSPWYLIEAILSLVFSLIIILSLRAQYITDVLIVYMLIAWVMIMGIFGIMFAIKLKTLQNELPAIFKNNRWIVILLIGILLVLISLYCMYVPAIVVTTLGLFISLSMIFVGGRLITFGTYAF